MVFSSFSICTRKISLLINNKYYIETIVGVCYTCSIEWMPPTPFEQQVQRRLMTKNYQPWCYSKAYVTTQPIGVECVIQFTIVGLQWTFFLLFFLFFSLFYPKNSCLTFQTSIVSFNLYLFRLWPSLFWLLFLFIFMYFYFFLNFIYEYFISFNFVFDLVFILLIVVFLSFSWFIVILNFTYQYFISFNF
jgi:hypothetical protein